MISFLFLFHFHRCGLPDSFEHFMRATLFHDSIWSMYVKADYNPFRIENPLLRNKCDCFHNGQTVAPFSLSFLNGSGQPA